VLRAGVTSRGVYLPRGGDWYDYWTGQRHAGGKWINVPVTLATLPLYVRAGAFLFGQPVVQHTGEMPGKPLVVTLFPGGNSERWLYEDAGNGFDAPARRRFSVREGVVEIGAPEGAYRPQSRELRLVVRGASAQRVLVNGTALTTGWEARDGAVHIAIPDRFERTEIRLER
jgi:hypothetical protein